MPARWRLPPSDPAARRFGCGRGSIGIEVDRDARSDPREKIGMWLKPSWLEAGPDVGEIEEEAFGEAVGGDLAYAG